MVVHDNKGEIDWEKEFDAEPVTFAMIAVCEEDVDDWTEELKGEDVDDWTMELQGLEFEKDCLVDDDEDSENESDHKDLALIAYE